MTSEDDFHYFHHLRNQCHRELTKDKENNQSEAFKKAEKKPETPVGISKKLPGMDKVCITTTNNK